MSCGQLVLQSHVMAVQHVGRGLARRTERRRHGLICLIRRFICGPVIYSQSLGGKSASHSASDGHNPRGRSVPDTEAQRVAMAPAAGGPHQAICTRNGLAKPCFFSPSFQSARTREHDAVDAGSTHPPHWERAPYHVPFGHEGGAVERRGGQRAGGIEFDFLAHRNNSGR